MNRIPTSSSSSTTNLDMSKSENFTQNLSSFYLNDYEEQPVNFICFRIKANLIYNNIISGKINFTNRKIKLKNKHFN